MNNICGINRIAPRWGFRSRGGSFHRALPCAIDFRAFSPKNSNSAQLKAESLLINSAGALPCETKNARNPEAPTGRNQREKLNQ